MTFLEIVGGLVLCLILVAVGIITKYQASINGYLAAIWLRLLLPDEGTNKDGRDSKRDPQQAGEGEESGEAGSGEDCDSIPGEVSGPGC